jgi:hypothetical protein
MWKAQFIDQVTDDELSVARDAIHKTFHRVTELSNRAPLSSQEDACEQLCAVEAEAMRRGHAYRDPFVWGLF